MRIQFLTVLLLCLVILTCTDCRRTEKPKPSERSKITILYGGDEYVLNPWGGNEADHLVFLPLLTTEKTGESKPHLAKSWEHSSDYLTWTIRIRDDVKWHDGIPVTAHDIKFSIELWAHPEVGMLGNIKSVSVIDDFTFQIDYKKPSQALLNQWQVYYPKHLLENLNPKNIGGWDFWTHPVGNGPYCYVRHVPKMMMEFEANPDYYRGKPRIERVILKFGNLSLVELLSENVDVLTKISPIDLSKLKEDPRFRTYYQQYIPDFLSICWNHRHPFFRDRTVRRALTLAINRRELLGVLNLPEDLPLSDVIFTRRQRGKQPESLPYDLERAQQLLEQVGWHDLDGDGIRERDGKEFRFTVLIRADRTREAVYIQDRLRRAGVRMEISTRKSDGIISQVIRVGDFEAVIRNLMMVLGTKRGQLAYFGEGSVIGYRNVRVVELLDVAEDTLDPEKLDALYHELWPFFQRDLPVTFLYPINWYYVAHRRVRGLSSPYRASPVLNIEHLWIEEEE